MRILATIALLALFLHPLLFAQTQSNSLQAQTSAEPVITHYSLTPDKLAQAKALYTTSNVLMVVGLVWGLLVLLGFLVWKIGPRYRNFSERVSRFRFVQAWVFVPLLLLTIAVFNLPLDMYSHHVSLKYGLSVQQWGSWFDDWAKGQLLSFVIGSVLLWLLYLIIRRSPRRCWFYFWLVFMPIMLFLVYIAPTVIDPMFNKFEPLEKTNPALVEQIERVTKRAGMYIPPSRMYEMKASEKVTTYNAYVTGFGATKRVVVWDNTARDLTVPETLFVFGHEMGHYVLNHIWKGMAFTAVLTFFLFYLVYSIVTKLVDRWGERLGIRGLDDWASLPLIMLVGGVIGFFAMPATSGFSRHIEHQADVYGLEVIHGLVPDGNRAAAASFQKLGEKSLDYPYPNRLLVFWTYSHPDIASRLEFALHYRPWDTGQPEKYVK
jgi:Zn-dependent protease with chaperone function